MSFLDSNCTVGLHVKQHLFLKMSFQRSEKTFFGHIWLFNQILKLLCLLKFVLFLLGGTFTGPICRSKTNTSWAKSDRI